MLGRMGRDASSPLAIQIASDSIRILELSQRRGRRRVSAWAIEPLLDAAGRASDTSLDALLAPLQRAVARCGSRQRQVVLALSAAQVICKRCSLPAGLHDQALEQQLLAEAENLFPVPLDDLALDFQVLGPAATPGYNDVLVAACRQSLIDPLERLCAEAGLEVAALEIDSLAWQRLLPDDADSADALLELESARSVLHAWSATGTPLQYHLPQALDLDGEDGTFPLQRLLLMPDAARPASRLHLTGAHASPALAERLQTRLGVPCRVLSPLPGLARDQALGDACASCMALPYSLALGGLQ